MNGRNHLPGLNTWLTATVTGGIASMSGQESASRIHGFAQEQAVSSLVATRSRPD